MNTPNLCGLFVFFNIFFSFAQQTIVQGSIKDMLTDQPLEGVLVHFEHTQLNTLTDALGEFKFSSNVPLGEQFLSLKRVGYLVARYPIIVSEGQILDIQDMMLEVDNSDDDLFTITLSDDELNSDTSGADNITGLLASSQDIFQRAAAFEFSSSFFRVRGLNSDNGTVLMNGIEMNKIYNGRPQWSNWGGLNDILRNQELTTGLAPSSYNFGGILGTTNINLRASEYQSGSRVTYSSSNRSYTNRVMATHASGVVKGDWSYAFSLGRRWGNEGYQDGTFYNANSFFVAVEKKVNDKHSLNFTGFYTPNKRGKSSPNTQEVYDLKNIKYNEYWGYQDGEKRNSRVKRIAEPVLMLNHYWDFTDKTSLNTNIAYQFGELGNSRLDYAGGANPSPSYYQGLPSYFLADTDGPDLAGAYDAYQNFTEEGQLDWNRLYDANVTNNITGDNAAYVLYEDRSDDTQLSVNTIINSEISEHVTLNAAINYKRLKSHNFAEIIDMLGSTTGYLNIDSFDQVQFDLQNPNQIVGEGDTFRYNYNLEANILSMFAQAQFTYNKVDFFLAVSNTKTSYQREGLYQSEVYADNSLGKGEKVEFTGIGTKGGFTYKFSGKHLLVANVGYLTKAPTIRNTFSSSRDNHTIVGDQSGFGINEEKISTFDLNYIYKSPIVKTRLTGYFTKMQDANEVSFYYADGISGVDSGTAFVQEVLEGIDKRHLGIEFGIEAQVTPTIKLTGVASVGQYTYDNNPNLLLTSSDFIDGLNFGEANLENYKIAGGPQRAASLGFEYRDPNYWWFGTTANFMSNAYVDVSPLTRTENFYLDTDGIPFPDYDPTLAKELLRQEKFDSYMLWNAVGGKSWKVGNKYISLFVSLNNILNTQFKTGGFEQGRNANFQSLKEDTSAPKRRFGPKYWFGRGTTYFINLNLRF
ncbi:TonB-dependent receptor [Formosa sp. Hel1_33_131]|uniref:TonB-dependent receptor n=1 Tax=Formosa sp. Hel1_33_131 TaxID=1336794 RepID=UPI000865C536|nr:TonB-dependent receptor [Formosa sp. Hel1_33_131]AOR28590.1 TonB-dependent receptor [Formosa sp. Hel1_33_131]